MKFTILYFSGTGNTELIANEIVKKLTAKNNIVECISIEDKEKLSQLYLTDAILGFGYPVYKFSYPDIFDNILPQINELHGKIKYFQFSTYARFDAYAFNDFAKKLNSGNLTLIAQKSFKAPSCGISARKPSDDYEYQSAMFFEDEINKRLDEFVVSILDNIDTHSKVKQNHNIIAGIKKAVVKDIEIVKYPKLTIDNSRCTKCGLCAKKCPDKNLIRKDSHIEIIDNKGCLHCLRCLNHCPANAITFGHLTEGDNQYTLKVRDELYAKSSNGYLEKYWTDFGNVIKKWQKNTIQYWITHKFNSKS